MPRALRTERRRLLPPRAASALVAWLWAGFCAVHGQSDDDVRGLALRPPHGSLELAWTRQEESNGNGGGDTRRSRDSLMEEKLHLATDGYVYHPNLLDLRVDVTAGVLQQWFASPGEGAGRGNGVTWEYDLHGQFLKEKAYPLTLFTSRQEGMDHRAFYRSVRRTVQTEGLSWSLRNPLFPLGLQLTRTMAQTAAYSADDTGTEDTDERLRLSGNRSMGELGDLSLSYERNSATRIDEMEQTYDTQRFDLHHTLDFGAADRIRVNSDVSWLRQSGTTQYEQFTWRERLQADHTDHLRSWYALNYDTTAQGAGGAQRQSVEASGGGRHQLYESLTSTLAASAKTTDYGDGGRQGDYDIAPGFTYRKSNPWGYLDAQYAFRYDLQDFQIGSTTRTTQRELRAFNDPSPIVLDSYEVDASSILVLKEDASDSYSEGEDYEVLDLGNRVEIRRVPTGHIADGETVWVQYEMVHSGSSVRTNLTHTYGIGQHFESGLSLYYRGVAEEQSVNPDPAGTAESIRNHRFGMRYLRGRLRALLEYEAEESNNSFNTTRFDAHWSRIIPHVGILGVGASWVKTSYLPPDARSITYRSLAISLTQPVGRSLSITATSRYREENDDVAGNTRGLDVAAGLRWHYRAVTFLADLEYDQYTRDNRRESSMQVTLKLIREF